MAKKGAQKSDPGLPPHDPEAEEGVVGSIIIEGSCLEEVRRFLLPSHFFRDKNRFVYEAMLALVDRDEPLDQLTLQREIARAGHKIEPEYLSHLVSQVPTSVNAVYYAGLVQSTYIQRLIINAAAAMTVLAYDNKRPTPEIMAQCQSLLAQVEDEIPATAIFTNLRKQDSDPPVYFLDVKGQTISLMAQDLANYKMVHNKILTSLNWVAPRMKTSEWDLVLTYLMGRVTVIEAPPEASHDNLVWMAVSTHLRSTPSDEALEVFEAGGVVEREGYIYIKGDSLLANVRHRMKEPGLKPNEFWAVIKKRGVERTTLRLGKKVVRCWRCRIDSLEESQDILEKAERESW